MARHDPGNRIDGLQIRKTAPITRKNLMNRIFPICQRVDGILWNA